MNCCCNTLSFPIIHVCVECDLVVSRGGGAGTFPKLLPIPPTHSRILMERLACTHQHFHPGKRGGDAKYASFSSSSSQRTRLRRFYAKWNCVIAQTLCSEKAYIRRQIDVKTTKCRDFTRILASFFLNSYNRRNIIVKTSQRRHFTANLREKKIRGKKARARAYMAEYGDFARLFWLFKFFSRKN